MMGEVEQTRRSPDYYKDIEYGKVAEADFETVYTPVIKKRGYSVSDVRMLKEYQNMDVDYVVKKDDKEIKIEVKLDSVALETGNIPYEVVSHGSLGWCSVTECDFCYYCFTDRDGTDIRKRAWIDMKKWREFCADRKGYKKLSVIKNESIVDLLCKINDLEKNSILTWINKSLNSEI